MGAKQFRWLGKLVLQLRFMAICDALGRPATGRKQDECIGVARAVSGLEA